MMGRPKNGVSHKWTETEIDFLRQVYPEKGRMETMRLFNEHFGLNVTKDAIKQQVQRYQIKAPTNGCFIKGREPHNKGVPMSAEQYAKCKRTMFKKGSVPPNKKELGSERITVDGYIEVKIAEPNKWELLQVLVIQGMIGRRLKKGVEMVRFLDGNTLNCDPANLMLTTRTVNARLNQRKIKPSSVETMKAAIQVETIKCLIRDKEQNNVN